MQQLSVWSEKCAIILQNCLYKVIQVAYKFKVLLRRGDICVKAVFLFFFEPRTILREVIEEIIHMDIQKPIDTYVGRKDIFNEYCFNVFGTYIQS